MDILILGGTVFLGRALAEAALQRGHRLTLFHRGRSNPELFPTAEKLHGDRKTDLSLLRGRRWDAVIDTCGYVPRVVALSAELLADNIHHYTFISSLSVYADVSRPGVSEEDAVGKLTDESVEEITGESYGPLKALCEQTVQRIMNGRALILRPGLIVGPFDPTDRFTYWPHRIAEGGDVLAPGRPDRAVQFIDVRDLAEWTIRLVEQRRTGVYNADSPAGNFTMGQLLNACATVAQTSVNLRWVSETFLLEQKVEPWSSMPLWIPESDAQFAGFFGMSVQRAIDAGMRIRDVEETVRATLEWDRSRPEHEWKAGISREREVGLLSRWDALNG